MKREALEHTKIRRLARLLGLQRWGAIGIMESIWHLAAKETPCGDIGKLNDDDIATTIEWKKKSGELVTAIVEAGFFDESEKYRLVIHDWWDHCDDGVHMKVARASKFFVCGRMPKLKRIAKTERVEIERAYKALGVCTESAQDAHGKRTASALPSLAKPSQALPSHEVAADDPIESWVEKLCQQHPAPSDPRYPSTFCTDNWHRLGEDHKRYEEFMSRVFTGLKAWCAHWELDGNRFAKSLDSWLSGSGWTKDPPTIPAFSAKKNDYRAIEDSWAVPE